VYWLRHGGAYPTPERVEPVHDDGTVAAL